MDSESASLNRHLKARIQKLAEPLEPIPSPLSPRLKRLSSIKAVLFDVYGTLLISGAGEVNTDSSTKHGNKAFQEALEEFSIPVEPGVASYNVSTLLFNTISAIRQKKRDQGIDYPEINILHVWKSVFRQLEADEIIRVGHANDDKFLRKFGVEFELRFNPCWTMPNAKELLSTLRSDKIMGIISNSQFYTPLTLEALTDTNLEKLGFDPSLLYWSYEQEIAKPDINFFKPPVRHLRNTHDIRPEEILYLGNDMLNDMYPADALGMQTALFAGDQRSLRLRENDQRTKNLEPTLQITDMLQLQECV